MVKSVKLCMYSTAVQRQKAISAYLILSGGFAEQSRQCRCLASL